MRRAAIPIVLLLGWVLAGRAAADLRLDAESQVGNAVDLRLRATNGADEERTGIRPPRGHREHRLAQHGMVRAVAVVLEEGEHRPDVAGTRRHVLHDDGQRRPPCGRYLGGSALRIRPEIRG